MPFYKILSDGKVLDVNDAFLRWQPRHGMMMLCEPHKGEFVCPRDNSAYYHPAWLNTPPPGAVYDGDIDCTEIDEAEYKELLELLDAGKTVENISPEPEPEQPTIPEESATTSTQPTVADMAQLMAEVASLREEIKQMRKEG